MEQPKDVEVVLAYDRELRVYFGVLCRYSTLFERLMTRENVARLSTRAKAQGRNVEKLCLMELDSMGRVMANSGCSHMLPRNGNGKVPLKLFEYYKNIFGTYYGNIIINDLTIATVLEDAVGLIEVAGYLGSTVVVAKSVDIALFKQAYRIKSELIFKESVIHLVGLLRERCKLMEMKVAAIYPSGIEWSEPSQIRHENYANDVMIWILLCFFCQWFTQAIIAGRWSLEEDGGYALYKQLTAGGDEYMNKPIMNGFQVRLVMTKRGQNVIEIHLFEIKECIRQCVQSGIMETESQFDTYKYGPTYLTSVKIEKSDYPWIGDAKATRVVSKQVRDTGEIGEEEVEVELDSDPDYHDSGELTKRARRI